MKKYISSIFFFFFILFLGLVPKISFGNVTFFSKSALKTSAQNFCNGPTPQYTDQDCIDKKGQCEDNYVSCVWNTVSSFSYQKFCTSEPDGSIACSDLKVCTCLGYNDDGDCETEKCEYPDFNVVIQQCTSNTQNNFSQALANACNLADKPAVCGNGIKEKGEFCDGGLAIPGQTCASDCKSICGDGVISGTESCDYNDPTPLPEGQKCDNACFLAISFPDAGVGFSDAELHSYQVAACTNDHTKKCDNAYNSCLTTYEGIAVGDNNSYECKKFGNGYHCKTKPFDDLYKKIQDMDFSVICPINTPTPSVCGNGKVEEGEMCDESTGNGSGSCDMSCQYHASTNANAQCFTDALNVCHQQKVVCDKVPNGKNCPESFHECLVNADKHCQIASEFNTQEEFGHGRGNEGGSSGCSMTETVSTFGSVTPALIFTFGLVPLIVRRLKRLGLQEKNSKEE